MDGGGVKAGVIIHLLRRLESHIQKITKNINYRLTDDIHMFTGTSAGGIMATALGVANVSLETLADTYQQQGKLEQIFDKSCLDRLLGEMQWKPKYNGKGKRKVIQEVLGSNLSFAAGEKFVMVPVYDLGSREIRFVTNRMFQQHHKNCDESIPRAWQVADATSAAPIYFPSVTLPLGNIWQKNKTSELIYPEDDNNHHDEGGIIPPVQCVDGGVEVNNPAAVALIMARQEFKTQNSDVGGTHIKLLSIGCGKSRGFSSKDSTDETREWGAIQWVTKGDLVSVLLGDTCMEKMCRYLLPDRGDYIRINGHLETYGVSDALDDTSKENIRAIERMADTWWEQYQYELLEFFGYA